MSGPDQTTEVTKPPVTNRKVAVWAVATVKPVRFANVGYAKRDEFGAHAGVPQQGRHPLVFSPTEWPSEVARTTRGGSSFPSSAKAT